MKLFAAAVAIALSMVMVGCQKTTTKTTKVTTRSDYRAQTDAQRAFREESFNRQAKKKAVMDEAEPILAEWKKRAVQRARSTAADGLHYY